MACVTGSPLDSLIILVPPLSPSYSGCKIRGYCSNLLRLYPFLRMQGQLAGSGWSLDIHPKTPNKQTLSKKPATGRRRQHT